VVANVKPVADVHAVAVDRNGFAGEYAWITTGMSFPGIEKDIIIEQFVMRVGRP